MLKNTMTIFCTVKFINLSGGFWGITDVENNKWFPINLPEALKKEGLGVRLKAQKENDYFSIYMWGTPVEILEFEIVA